MVSNTLPGAGTQVDIMEATRVGAVLRGSTASQAPWNLQLA